MYSQTGYCVGQELAVKTMNSSVLLIQYIRRQSYTHLIVYFLVHLRVISLI